MQITFYPQIYIQLPPLVLFCRNEGIWIHVSWLTMSSWTQHENPLLLTQVLWFSIWNDEFHIHNFIGKFMWVSKDFCTPETQDSRSHGKRELTDFPWELLSLDSRVWHQLCEYEDATKGSEPFFRRKLRNFRKHIRLSVQCLSSHSYYLIQ
jgi:hypothetical protein